MASSQHQMLVLSVFVSGDPHGGVDVIQLIPPHATIRPWIDPVVNQAGATAQYVCRALLAERARPDGDLDHAALR